MGVSPLQIPPYSDLYIAEPGLYALILRSRKPEAEKFNDWVCEEVLPQIKATGSYASRKPQSRLQLQLIDEKDLHYKVVDFIRTFHHEALLVAGLGELQDTEGQRIDAWKKGYTKGQSDIMLANHSGKWVGLAIELKTPACTGHTSPEQKRFLEKLGDAGWKTVLSNNYDEVCNEIRDYFRGAKVMCRKCGAWLKNCNLQAHLLGHDAANEERESDAG